MSKVTQHAPITEAEWRATEEYRNSSDWGTDLHETRPVIVEWPDPTETPSQCVSRLNAEVLEQARTINDLRRELFIANRTLHAVKSAIKSEGREVA